MIAIAILACEAAFWILLAAGLACRYVARKRLLGGATANWTHAVAAGYLRVSAVFGHSMLSWLDVRFAHRFDGGVAPIASPALGPAGVKREWKARAMTVLSWAISCSLLLIAIAVVGLPERTTALEEWVGRYTLILVICTISPIGRTIWPGTESEERAAETATTPKDR